MPLHSEILKSCKKNITTFIETGSYLGDGIQAALDAGFDKIYSIEFYDSRYEFCKKRFATNGRVEVVHGDSAQKLQEILSLVQERALFWLDAHYDACNTEPEFPIPLTEPFPLLKELNQISAHLVKNHTILIDDRRIFTGENPTWHRITEETVIKELASINAQYSIRFIDSSHFKEDIIVAEAP